MHLGEGKTLQSQPVARCQWISASGRDGPRRFLISETSFNTQLHLVMADFIQGLDASKLILAEAVSIYTFHRIMALVTLAFTGPLFSRQPV